MIPQIFNNIKTINVYYKLCNKTGMSTIHVADKHENIKLYGAHNVVHIYWKDVPKFSYEDHLKAKFYIILSCTLCFHGNKRINDVKSEIKQ